MRWLIQAVVLTGLLSGCGSLSGGGPSAGTLQDSPAVDLVKVTPAIAAEQAAAAHNATAASIDGALVRLRTGAGQPEPALGPGTRMTVSLWSYAPRPGLASGPVQIALGSFALNADGTASLPYIGRVHLAGTTLLSAESTLESRYAATGMFQKPSIAIEITAMPQGQIVVTGAIGAPRLIPWSPAGLTLTEVLTQSLGDGLALLSQNGDASGHGDAISVVVEHAGGGAAELPITVALEESIALRPGDRVIVKKAPAVEVTVLGPGMQANGIFDFGHVPVLSEAIARGAGLNPNSANDHAVFVLRQVDGRAVLYDFQWDKAEGLVASHLFPLKSGDMVYVAEAPIVPVQRVINLLFQAALPAQFIK